jgi:hypothetical protein
MGRTPLALGSAQTSILQETGVHRLALASRARLERPQVRIVRGREAVLNQLDTLRALCAWTGQESAARWLEFQMGTPAERKKIPTLVMIGKDWRVGAARFVTDDFFGAAILYEYKIAGCGLRIFAGDDSTGQRAVVGLRQQRALIAEAACRGLVDAGALAAMVCSEGQDMGEEGTARQHGYSVGTRYRQVPLYLPLGSTFEQTLAGLGRHTRRNLRYYRKRVETLLGAEFVPQARLSRDEFIRSNVDSANPVSTAVAAWRHDTFARGAAGMMFAGVRSKDGRWLSVIGGRRCGPVLEIDWQMNSGEMPRLSLSTVMRSYLLEHEVKLGTRTLVFNGGTPHTMRHSFASVDVTDTLVLGKSPGARMLRALAPSILPKTNFLVQALCDSEMRWASA